MFVISYWLLACQPMTNNQQPTTNNQQQITMPFFNSVERSYTPPTCTLKIRAKSSPLSRWVGQSVLKELGFELSFDDPRQTQEQQVTIQGNRADLEMLSEAVNGYVQNLLESSAKSMPLLLPMTNGNHDQKSLSLVESGLTPPILLADQESEEALDKLDNSSLVPSFPSNPKLLTLKSATPFSPIYLEPKGLIAHNLFLGQLATQESGPVIELTVLQLFDLATALEQYATEVVALPTLSQPGQKTLPVWARAAAALVLAVGVTTAGFKLLEQSNTNEQAAAPQAEQDSSTKEPKKETPLLTKVPPAPTPTLVAPSPPAATPKLLPPARVTPPPPEAGSPGPVISNSPPPVSTGRTTTIIQPQSSAPITSQAPVRSQTPIISQAPVRSQTPIISQTPVSSQTPVIRQTPSPSPTTANRRSRATTSPRNEPPVESSRPSPLATPPPLPNLPPLGEDTSIPEVADSADSAAPLPSTTSLPSPVASLPSPITSSPGSLAQRESDPPQSPTNTQDNTQNKLFDAIPQVKEVRDYLQQKWQPPAELEQILEYRLVLNTDGSLQRIIPLGEAATKHIERTSIPKVGEPFVSPVEGEDNPTIRVVLKQDGQVETFLE
ncbi:MAG: DUF4335 domain-containing protein [Symploca sp. SIO2E6]|nr:DUF4335 domain-containing protein [Symploca sp. SIO2E6]